MYDTYKIMAYCFVCVVILAITIVCVNNYADNKSKGWKIDCIGIIDFPLYVVAMLIMDVPVKAATGCILVSLLIIMAATKEARKGEQDERRE